jgi:PAS domain S-box-containing protein
VVTTDIEGRVTYMNPVAEGLTGYKLGQAEGQPLENIFVILNEQTGVPAESPVRKVLEHGLIVGLANHTVLVRSDHTTLPIDDSGAPIRDKHGRLIGVVLVFHEVGERRRMEHELRQQAEELREAGRRKDQFLAMLAHELRNPLAPLRNCAELLKLGEHTQMHHSVIAGMLERQTAHLTRLVDDLLDISRITRGTIRLQREPVLLATVIDQAIETARSYIEQRGHQLHLRPPAKEIVVYGDAIRLTQVFCNLLNNAAKFMEPNGQIFLSAEIDGSAIVVRIRDYGEGLTPELIPSIFDLFVQGHVEVDRSQTGLGIGLTLVKTLVDMHGGKVSVTSEGPGKGSEFAVHLPIANAAQVETAALVQVPTRIQKKILVVDDNVDAAESMAFLLRTWGCDVAIVNDGASAIEAARSQVPDVVLLDIGMPGMDGFEVARRLRRLPKGSGMLLVAVTGYGSDLDRQRSAEAGIDVHLSKPVDYKTLKQVVSEH